MNLKQDLPMVLKPSDITSILRCSKPKTYELIKEAEIKGYFHVKRVGNSPRIPRDSFLNWLEGHN